LLKTTKFFFQNPKGFAMLLAIAIRPFSSSIFRASLVVVAGRNSEEVRNMAHRSVAVLLLVLAGVGLTLRGGTRYRSPWTPGVPEKRTFLLFHTCSFNLADMQVSIASQVFPKGANIVVLFDCREQPDVQPTWVDLNVKAVAVNEQHLGLAGTDPSTRNSKIVTWAFHSYGIPALEVGSAVGLLDGDVLPIAFHPTNFDRHVPITCRRHPNPKFSYCWIGLIFVQPSALRVGVNLSELNFMPDPEMRLDSGGGTYHFFNKNVHFGHAWCTEMILTNTGFAGGMFDDDLRWIQSHFGKSDKCGSELYVQMDSLFYHMISASSSWRFGPEVNAPRINALKQKVVSALPYPNTVHPWQGYAHAVPPFGNFTCH
jgi:hypothetical protein